MRKKLIFLFAMLAIVLAIFFIPKAVFVLTVFIVLILCAMVFVAIDDI